MNEQLQESNIPQTDPLHLANAIEGTIASSMVTATEPPEEPDITTFPTVPLVPVKREFHINYWFIVACLLALALLFEHVTPFIVTLFHKPTIVTLFAARKDLVHTYSFLAVTGTADQTANQVPSRIITSTPPPQHLPITTTGRAQTLPTQATGSIILYNEAPYYQTIQAGTVITGNDSIQIVSDQSVMLAPGNGTTNGSATVYAHTLQAGTQANISPFDINRLCCLSGILAKNTSYFYGGKDPQTYPIVSSSDIHQAEKQAALTLDPLAQSALAKQIQPQEKTLTPVTCSLKSLSDPKIGQRAIRATVTVTETCTTQVFNFATLQEKSRANYIQDAGTTLGSAYLPTGKITIAISKHTLLDTRHKTYTLSVSASGQLVFKPSASQIQSIKKHIAGMRLIDAKWLLLATMQAVQGIDIQPSNTSDNTLPVDPNQIDIKIFS